MRGKVVGVSEIHVWREREGGGGGGGGLGGGRVEVLPFVGIYQASPEVSLETERVMPRLCSSKPVSSLGRSVSA